MIQKWWWWGRMEREYLLNCQNATAWPNNRTCCYGFRIISGHGGLPIKDKGNICTPSTDTKTAEFIHKSSVMIKFDLLHTLLLCFAFDYRNDCLKARNVLWQNKNFDKIYLFTSPQYRQKPVSHGKNYRSMSPLLNDI